MQDLLVGSSLIAAVLSGAVALFAPCCISVMLPAYFATSFQRRRALVSMTFVFAAGVAAIILPIALGASGLSRLIFGHHTTVFVLGGIAMLAMGIATIAGWRPYLPTPGMRASSERHAGSVFALGAFSGTASACCAPVLAGVVALSGASGSFVVALSIGAAYVFGMVLPLFLIALLWDRYDWGSSFLLRGRSVRMPLPGRVEHRVQLATLVAGMLLLLIGGLTIAVGLAGPSMAESGWQASLTSTLDHWSSRVLSLLEHVPGWIVALVLVAAVTSLALTALRQTASEVTEGDDESTDEPQPAAARAAAAPVEKERDTALAPTR